MNRRSFVRSLALAPVAGAIGCTTAGSGSDISPALIAGDVTNITNGLAALLAAPSVQAALSPAAAATLTRALTDAQATATQVAATSASVTLPTAQGWVQTVATDVSTILAVVAVIPGLPPQVTVIVAAIQTLLPLVEVAVALVSTASVGATPMTPSQARQILQNLK